MFIMSANRNLSTLKLTAYASNAIPNYDLISKLLKIPKMDGVEEFKKLSFLHTSEFAILEKNMPFPEKRILNIPHKRMNNWNNYIVHSRHPDNLESWRDECKIPDNWIGPELKKNS